MRRINPKVPVILFGKRFSTMTLATRKHRITHYRVYQLCTAGVAGCRFAAALALVIALALDAPAEARDTGCNVTTIRTTCTEEDGALKALKMALDKYTSTYGQPATWDTRTTLYDHEGVIAVCGWADNTRFLWTWSSDDGETITHGKTAKLSWGLLCN